MAGQAITAVLSGEQTVELTTDEILLLRFTCDLFVDEESAFGPLVDRGEPEALRASARSLVDKGLADRKTYRPHRELLRRMLVVAQPDCRIILLAAEPGRGERLLDLYGRAGAYVSHVRSGDQHRVGPPLQLVDVFDDVIARFSPRRSTGDFVDLRLTPREHYAFTSAAIELANRKARGINNVRLDSARPTRALGDTTLEGAMVMPGKKNRLVGGDAASLLPIPDDAEWRLALHGLAEKGAIRRIGATYELSGYLHDLAIGLSNRTRHVLTRIEFSGEDWPVRDVTLVHVPGSLFRLRPTGEGGLSIREVDPEELRRAVRETIGDLA